MRLLICYFLLLTFNIPDTIAQRDQYVVFFKDKVGNGHQVSVPEGFLSAKAVERREKQGIPIRESDMPVSQPYLESLAEKGATVIYTTKWLNGALIEIEAENIHSITDLDFIIPKEINLGTLAPHSSPTFETPISPYGFSGQGPDYGNSFLQNNIIETDLMHEAGYFGEGISIAVIDAGFGDVDQIPSFDSLFVLDRIKYTYDFVDREENVYDNHRHGMQVLSVLAGHDPGNLIGTAFRADYYLFRTEDVTSESRIEEFYWLMAAEFADSAGVDIINTSLGYHEFDNEVDDYQWDDLDGGSAFISIAANMAASTGMLVVASAGNEGNKAWIKLTPPADSGSVLTVGAVSSFGDISPFSSRGPSADGRVKPDVMAMGSGVVVHRIDGGITSSSGTSFAAPAITGLAAGLWQAFPQLTNFELMEMIRKGSDQYHNPNHELGFGIPKFSNIFKLITEELENPPLRDNKIQLFPNPMENQLFLDISRLKVAPTFLEINLFGASGQQLGKWQISPDREIIEIPLANISLAKGLYFLRVNSGQHIHRLKFLKE